MDFASALLSQLFNVRDQAHINHLTTNSYARHIALNELYEGIIPLADEFAETYQGIYGIVSGIVRAPNTSEQPVEAHMESLSVWIEANRSQLVTEKDKALHAILDDILVFIYKTLYKLRNLK